MIGKFNFYDIYGYLVPGLVLLTLLWLPYGMASGHWPGSGALITALLGIPLAYVAGHLLQSRAIHVFPSTDKGHYPSDILLDAADKTFSPEFKKKLAALILERFQLDVNEPPQRRDAFFLCRSLLIEGKTTSYGEQFEGLYAMMRGLVAAFLLASAHYAGWALAAWKYDCLSVAAVIVLIAGLIVSIIASLPVSSFAASPAVARWAFYSLLPALVSAGYLLGCKQPEKSVHDLWGWFIVMAITAFLMALKCLGTFKGFTWDFPKTIYRDFYTSQLRGNAPGAGKPSKSNDEEE